MAEVVHDGKYSRVEVTGSLTYKREVINVTNASMVSWSICIFKSFVSWVILWTNVLKFASLQSDFAKSFLPEDLVNSADLDSIVFSDGKKFYTKSSAVLEICKSLGGGFHFFRIGYLLPSFLRNAVYTFIANNRYKWFGKKDQCMIPTADLKERFLDWWYWTPEC